MKSKIAIGLARMRMGAVMFVIGLLLADARWRLLPGAFTVYWLLGMALIVAMLRSGTLRRRPVALQLPVAGRWLAHNSPSSRVPSHGVQSYGQTYAIDMVADPPTSARPSFGWRPIARRPQEYPGFGAPLYAPSDGTVVRVHDRERDHLSRTSPLGLAYMFTVELFRELLGPNRILGNHLVIDRGDGTFVVLAHLRNRSILVEQGQQVAAGDVVGRCGNSGNSTEPHLHLQVMDHPRPLIAAGVPFRFETRDGSMLETPLNGAHVHG